MKVFSKVGFVDYTDIYMYMKLDACVFLNYTEEQLISVTRSAVESRNSIVVVLNSDVWNRKCFSSHQFHFLLHKIRFLREMIADGCYFILFLFENCWE